MAKSKRPFEVPITGDLEHNLPIFTLVGQLVVAWANNETVLHAIYWGLLGGKRENAAVLWDSHSTSRKRVETILTLAAANVSDADLRNRIEGACSQFRSLSKLRNFYCHAMYNFEAETGKITHASLLSIDKDATPIAGVDQKRLDRGSMNNIKWTINALLDMNFDLWILCRDTHLHFGACDSGIMDAASRAEKLKSLERKKEQGSSKTQA